MNQWITTALLAMAMTACNAEKPKKIIKQELPMKMSSEVAVASERWFIDPPPIPQNGNEDGKQQKMNEFPKALNITK